MISPTIPTVKHNAREFARLLTKAPRIGRESTKIIHATYAVSLKSIEVTIDDKQQAYTRPHRVMLVRSLALAESQR